MRLLLVLLLCAFACAHAADLSLSGLFGAFGAAKVTAGASISARRGLLQAAASSGAKENGDDEEEEEDMANTNDEDEDEDEPGDDADVDDKEPDEAKANGKGSGEYKVKGPGGPLVAPKGPGADSGVSTYTGAKGAGTPKGIGATGPGAKGLIAPDEETGGDEAEVDDDESTETGAPLTAKTKGGAESKGEEAESEDEGEEAEEPKGPARAVKGKGGADAAAAAERGAKQAPDAKGSTAPVAVKGPGGAMKGKGLGAKATGADDDLDEEDDDDISDEEDGEDDYAALIIGAIEDADLPECTDSAPRQDGQPPVYTCKAMQKWGKCGTPEMDGFCCITCGGCQDFCTEPDLEDGDFSSGAWLSATANDIPPPSNNNEYPPKNTCRIQKKWGKCGTDIMKAEAGGAAVYCCDTCGGCDDDDNEIDDYAPYEDLLVGQDELELEELDDEDELDNKLEDTTTSQI